MNTGSTFVTNTITSLKKNKFSYVPSILNVDSNPNVEEWEDFKKSWHDLCMDTFMGDNGKYRYRRYSVLSWDNEKQTLSLEKHQPHYQDVYFNNLNGG